MISIDIAYTPDELSKGLMFIKTMPWNYGMLFVFRQPQILSFWGLNTYLNLDIAFIDQNGYIVNIQKINKNDLNPVKSKQNCIFALQVNRGYFDNAKITEGHKIKITDNYKHLHFQRGFN